MPTFVIAAVAGVTALIVAVSLAIRVMRANKGNPETIAIGAAIQSGAMAFMKLEYRKLLPFVIVVAAVLWIVIDIMQFDSIVPRTAIAYVAGSCTSALAGFLGMSIAIRANTRTAATAQTGLNPALKVAFSSGAVMGLTVVGLGILGVTILYLIFQDITYVAGFGLGASSIALFARVGGGIFTKAADVGADLVGKLEAGMPEDDPRNPAVIADNVGDNVGDVAGMGADLFESYVSSIIAAIALAGAAVTIAFTGGPAGQTLPFDDDLVVLPLLIAASGILASVLGTFLVRSKEQASFSDLLWSLRRGIFGSAIIVVLLSLGAVIWLDIPLQWNAFSAIVAGLVAGVIIGLATEYYTSYDYGPTKKVAKASQTGYATVVISGLAKGMMSTLIPVLTVCGAIMVAFELYSFYGVALAGVGMLSTLGITLATDAYGPVADNAGGIAEQAHLSPEVRQRTDALDALGNTTAATGKGFAIGSATLTALALMATYAIAANLFEGGDERNLLLNLLDHRTLVGLLIGGLLPFIFSALTMQAVVDAAAAIVSEVRDQLPRIMTGEEKPDYDRCVEIGTRDALRAMITPGIMAVVVPIAVGFILGKDALGGLLIGAVSAGFLLAITMANSGGIWDNAKKYIELGNFGGKGSDAHKAAVVGDTVGDPFKDTSGPSLNILLKLMAIVALIFAPALKDATPLLGG